MGRPRRALPRLSPLQAYSSAVPHTTYAGRVVYNRPLHEFKPSDIERITRKVLSQSEMPASDIVVMVRDLMITILEEMFSVVGYEDIVESLFILLETLVGKILQQLRLIGTRAQFKRLSKELLAFVGDTLAILV